MKNVVIVPAYGDRTDYISFLTRKWPKRYGLQPHVYPFGTTNASETYDENWSQYTEFVSDLGQVSIIGASFGGTVADRSLIELPNVTKTVKIASPHSIKDFNRGYIEKNYPMLALSLKSYDPEELPAERIMTIAITNDKVIPPNMVPIEGAYNITLSAPNHGLGIVTAFAIKGRQIADFLHDAT